MNTTQRRQPAGAPTGGQFAATARPDATTLTPGTPRLADAPVPVVSFDELWHLGTFDPAAKKDWSYEGVGLSVSVHPDEWERIARLGGSPRWVLTRPGNTFLDYHELTDAQRTAVTDWGLRRGYIEPVTAWRVTWEDEDTEELVSLLCTSAEDAEEEAEGRDADVTEEVTHATTPTFPDPTVRPGILNEHQILTTVWATENTTLDGVWWEDRYDPDNLSCPRGVILPGRLDTWAKVPEQKAAPPHITRA